MFERYTEKARRVIFFARYEASQYGSPYIETEHLLLGLLREDKRIFLRLKFENAEAIRREVDVRSPKLPSFSTSRDLPLSNESKRVLEYALEEADLLEHRHIGTEHLLVGLLREENWFAAGILLNHGIKLEPLREELAKGSHSDAPKPELSKRPSTILPTFRKQHRRLQDTVEIHGARWDSEYIRDRVKACGEIFWHWHQQPWQARDIAVHRKDGRISLDLTLVESTQDFDLVKAGWKKDHCYVCRWELFESKDDPTHGTGYTNGREWLCTECYEKFWGNPNFFASNYPDIT